MLFAIRDNIEVYFIIHIVHTEKMDSTIIVYIVNKTCVRWNNYRKFITGRIRTNGMYNCFMFHVYHENIL